VVFASSAYSTGSLALVKGVPQKIGKKAGQIYLKDLSRFHVIKAHRIYTSRLNIVDAGLRALEPSLTGKARHISYSFSEIHNWERKRWFSRK
jgi:hypothetical protein